MQDAGEVMQLLLKVQTEQGEELEDDDPQVSSQTQLLQVMMMSLPVLTMNDHSTNVLLGMCNNVLCLHVGLVWGFVLWIV